MKATREQMMRLSPTQVTVLRAARDGHLFRSNRIGRLYLSSADNGISFNERTIDKLTELELMELGESIGDRTQWKITTDGALALQISHERERRRLNRTRRRFGMSPVD